MATYQTEWGADAIEIRADFAQASCPVEGTGGMQVADFQHRPAWAMRHAIEMMIRAEGRVPEDCTREIHVALASMIEIRD